MGALNVDHQITRCQKSENCKDLYFAFLLHDHMDENQWAILLIKFLSLH
ncbi:MAG: hypothetical protein ACJATI_004326 [Halioglobus sp.]|jgi:hypothetical protein